MSLRKLPPANLQRPTLEARTEISESAITAYNAGLRAAGDDEPGTIGLYSPIGAMYEDGWTPQRMSAVLRNIGRRDVVVNINTPGGSYVDGLAMYNLLRDHPGKVVARVVGMAASAGSIVAMAADEIQIANAAGIMIHNTQYIQAGDRNAMRAAADWMEENDRMLAQIYASRTGKSVEEVAAMLDAETWLYGQGAIEAGFADALLPADRIEEDERKASNGLRAVEERLRASGLSRSSAQAIIAEVKAAVSDSRQPVGLSDSACETVSGIAEALKIINSRS
jgi:ATP-dependent protease ClpP protease subunit